MWNLISTNHEERRRIEKEINEEVERQKKE